MEPPGLRSGSTGTVGAHQQEPAPTARTGGDGAGARRPAWPDHLSSVAPGQDLLGFEAKAGPDSPPNPWPARDRVADRAPAGVNGPLRSRNLGPSFASRPRRSNWARGVAGWAGCCRRLPADSDRRIARESSLDLAADGRCFFHAAHVLVQGVVGPGRERCQLLSKAMARLAGSCQLWGMPPRLPRARTNPRCRNRFRLVTIEAEAGAAGPAGECGGHGVQPAPRRCGTTGMQAVSASPNRLALISAGVQSGWASGNTSGAGRRSAGQSRS